MSQHLTDLNILLQNIILAGSLFLNVFLAWFAIKKEITLPKEARSRIVSDIRMAKSHVMKRELPGFIGFFESFNENRRRIRWPDRKEIARFVALCSSYNERYGNTSRHIRLIVYEAITRRIELPRRRPAKTADEIRWVIQDASGSRTSYDTLDRALVEMLVPPLLNRQQVAWGWIEDRQLEFAGDLESEGLKDGVMKVLQEIEKNVEQQAGPELSELHDLRTSIADFEFKWFDV